MSEPVSEVEAELGYPTSLDEWGLPVDGPPMKKDQTQPALLLEESLVRHAAQAGVLWRVVFNDRVDYYDASGRLKYVFPDVYAVVGVPQQAKGPFRTFVHGRAPDAAFEFSVEGSLGMDRREKQERYREIGVREYFVFDVEARQIPGLLEGWLLVGGAYQPLASVSSPLGGHRLASAALGVELEAVACDRCPEGYALRAFLPGARDPLPTPEEARLRATTRERDEATRERDEATRERDEATRERDEARERLRELESELRRLRGEDGESTA